jgi:hypothetical protein
LSKRVSAEMGGEEERERNEEMRRDEEVQCHWTMDLI